MKDRALQSVATGEDTVRDGDGSELTKDDRIQQLEADAAVKTAEIAWLKGRVNSFETAAAVAAAAFRQVATAEVTEDAQSDDGAS